MSLRWRLLLLIMVTAGVILCAVIVHSTAFARRALGAALRDKAAEMATRAAADADAKLRLIARAVEMMAAENAVEFPDFVADGPERDREARHRLTRLLNANPEIYGAAIALDPGLPDLAGGFSPYLCRDVGSKLRFVDLANPDYDYSTQLWYARPRREGRVLWSDPAFDQGGGNALMVTCSVPFRFASGSHAPDGLADGIQTGDVTLGWLTDMLQTLPLGKDDHAFLLTPNGTVIAHPRDADAILINIAALVGDHGDPAVGRWSAQLLSEQPGIISVRNLFSSNASAWAAHQPVPTTGWIMVAILSQADAERRLGELAAGEAAIGVLGLALLLASGLFIANSVARPLQRLTAATQEMSRGNLDEPLPTARGEDEVANLTRHFSSMRGELKRSMENLAAAAAARERIESELRIAAGIQRSFLPPATPSHPAIELAAVFKPAREVGGDLYDMRLDAGAERLFLVIGDVSGKGVPAALFMARAGSLWRTFIGESDSPAHILSRLNRELAKDNAAYFFITVFCAVVDLRDGVMRYASGGHLPQGFRAADGTCRWLATPEETPPSLPPGLEEDTVYREKSLRLSPGDMLVLFTDGLNEAENAAGELLGSEPVLEELAAADGDCAATLGRLEALADRHAAGAEQSDDFTMVAFRCKGGWK